MPNALHECDPHKSWSIDSPNIAIKMPVHGSLTSTEKSFLFQLYCKLYSVSDTSSVVMSTLYVQYSHIHINNKQLGSFRSRSSSSSTVEVSWVSDLFGAQTSEVNVGSDSRVARINYFIKHAVTINGQNKTHLLAHLSWFLYHPKHTFLANQLPFGTMTFLSLVVFIH